jgi:membrane protease subunit HflC
MEAEETQKTESKINIWSLLSGILVAVGLISYMTMFTVRKNEIALVYTFNKPSDPIKESGLYFKAPWPVQKAVKFSLSIRIFSGTFEESYTGDGKNIILEAFVCWKIDDPRLYMKMTSGDRRRAESLLKDVVRNHKGGVLGKHPLTHLISTKPEDIQFTRIQDEILAPVAREAKAFGIDVQEIGIKRLALPEKTVEVVFERMRKERQKLADRFEAEGERLASIIRSDAQKEATNELTQAEAKAKAIRGQADAEAASYYKILSQDPELADFLRKMESFKNMMKDKDTTLILTTNMGPFQLLEEAPEGPAGKTKEER